MSFLDKLKQGVHAVAGTAAKVEVKPAVGFAFQGDKLWVAITAQSTGSEVKFDNVFVDVVGQETIKVGEQTSVKETAQLAVRVAGGGTIAPGATAQWHAAVEIPATLAPTYEGVAAQHAVQVRARLDMQGTDPSSNAVPLTVIRRPA
jgi:hypothetical protein